MLNGMHAICWWCKLQSTIARSSCEAELNAYTKGASEGLNAQGIAPNGGVDPNLEFKTDASAARGVIMRQGVGEHRHLHIQQLWLQERVAKGDMVVTKIDRSANMPDALTHPWTAADQPFWSAMGGFALHPATPSGPAPGMTRRDDRHGQGPLGPTCGLHCGLLVIPVAIHHKRLCCLHWYLFSRKAQWHRCG